MISGKELTHMSGIIKGYFFDLDGTLVDTYEADYLAYRDAIANVTGLFVRQEEFAATHGMEMRRKLERLAPNLDEADIQEIAIQKKTHYHQYVHLTKPNQALIPFLKALAAESSVNSLALVTTAKRQNAELVLETHGLGRYFSHYIFGDEIMQPKPDPESYLLALKKTCLKPEEVVAFEDSDSGIAAALAADIAVIPIRSFL